MTMVFGSSTSATRLATSRGSMTPAGIAIAVTDTVMWGVAIRNGYDELDDPSYHRGLTGHAYLKGSDHRAMCGYRPPQRSLLTRQRGKLGMLIPGVHGKCEACAEAMVAPSNVIDDSVNPNRPKVPMSIRVAFAALR